MNKVPMTTVGAECLRKELQRLKTVDRPAIINAIAEARAHGDLKENAEYHAAREQQSFVEGRILEIESKLANAHIIDIRAIEATGKVMFGVTVKLINLSNNEEIQYQIVGDDEASIKDNKISINSPLARALISHTEGEFVEVKAPGGIVEYEIASVKHL